MNARDTDLHIARPLMRPCPTTGKQLAAHTFFKGTTALFRALRRPVARRFKGATMTKRGACARRGRAVAALRVPALRQIRVLFRC